jgi:hypothetical protein
VPILSLSSFLISLLVASSCIPRVEGYSLLGRITPDAVVEASPTIRYIHLSNAPGAISTTH